MRYFLWFFVLTAVAVATTGCKEKIGQKISLQIENVSSSEERSMMSGEIADNSRWHVCHISYEEELALNHELECLSCEGHHTRV